MAALVLNHLRVVGLILLFVLLISPACTLSGHASLSSIPDDLYYGQLLARAAGQEICYRNGPYGSLDYRWTVICVSPVLLFLFCIRIVERLVLSESEGIDPFNRMITFVWVPLVNVGYMWDMFFQGSYRGDLSASILIVLNIANVLYLVILDRSARRSAKRHEGGWWLLGYVTLHLLCLSPIGVIYLSCCT